MIIFSLLGYVLRFLVLAVFANLFANLFGVHGDFWAIAVAGYLVDAVGQLLTAYGQAVVRSSHFGR